MTGVLTLWTYALVALLFGLAALVEWRRTPPALPRIPFVAALALTALWALAAAGIDARDVATRAVEGLRNLAWLALMAAVARRHAPRATLTLLYGVVAAVVVGGVVLAVAEALSGDPALTAARVAMRAMAAAGALLLVHHLHLSGGVRTRALAVALAAFWGLDLTIYVIGWAWPAWPATLIVARGIAMLAIWGLLALATHREGERTLQPSRAVALRTLAVAAVALYVSAMTIAVGAIDAVGGAHARVAQTAFVFGSTVALVSLLATPWVRAWTRVILVKHLFAHRYDYRAEWLRFSTTLGEAHEPLPVRVIRAIADATAAPGGVLLLAEEDGSLAVAATAGWQGQPEPADAALARHLAATRRIVDCDAVTAGEAPADECAAVPAWIAGHADAWAIVPLIHADRLVGAVLLARPPVARRIDWEDIDLLGVAGRQAASHLAEDRAREALGEAARFDEFNRKFAFIMHDLKNLVSQHSLVARNAERHADNPAFRADMVATLNDSADRMTALLARLAQASPAAPRAPVPVALMPLAQRVAAARRAQRTILCTGDAEAIAAGDPAALEQLLGHLVQNAIEASAPDAAVTLVVHRDGIEVADAGCGMSAAFVRTRLFKPFDSAKPGGFGLGAYEARALARAMGGELTVTSREGAGSRFRVTLPPAPSMEEAA